MLGIHLGSHEVVAERLVIGIHVAQRIKRFAELGNETLSSNAIYDVSIGMQDMQGAPGIGWADGDVYERSGEIRHQQRCDMLGVSHFGHAIVAGVLSREQRQLCPLILEHILRDAWSVLERSIDGCLCETTNTGAVSCFPFIVQRGE